MKKNLRIVSAAAAALLAVAPVAATAMPVNADSITAGTQVGTVKPIANNAKVNITPNVTLNTAVAGTSIKAALHASFTATVNGTTATSALTPNVSSVQMWANDSQGNRHEVNNIDEIGADAAGTLYKVQLNKVSLNFGTANANKKFTLVLPNENGNHFGNSASQLTKEVETDGAGVATIDYVVLGVYAKNFANPVVVEWYNSETGATVTSGNIELNAGSDAGKMNVAQVAQAIAKKYTANSLKNTVNDPFTYTSANEIAEQLKAQGITVDAQGWFVAPKSFTVNYKATAAKNDAASTLAVVVNVPNGKVVTPAVEASKSATVMHNAYFYDKDGKRVGSDKAATYSSIELATDASTKSGYKEATIGGKTYYKVANKDEYVNASNITGVKKTLKKNAYVYKTSKKRANKVTLKKGSEVTVYGSAVKLANGKSYYRIGQTKYVKKANF